MRKSIERNLGIPFGLGLLMTIIIHSALMAQGVVATVSDLTGNQVKLTKLTTSEMSFSVGDSVVHIPIEQIKEIRAVSGKNVLEVVLVSGNTVSGTSEGQIAGQWELGSYTLALSKCQRIVFERGSISPPADWKQPPGYVATVNEIEVYALAYQFTYRGCDAGWIPCKGYSANSILWHLPVLRGEMLYFVPFSAIAQASPTGVDLKDNGKLEGILSSPIKQASIFGNEYPFEGQDRKLIGQTMYGRIEFPIEKVKSVVFHHDRSLQQPEAPPAQAPPDLRFLNDTSVGAQGLITTVTGISALVTRLEYFRVAENYSYIGSSTMGVRIGESVNQIEIAKLSGVKDFSVTKNQNGVIEKLDAKILTKSGTTLAVQFVSTTMCFGGPTNQGYVKVCLADLKSIEIK